MHIKFFFVPLLFVFEQIIVLMRVFGNILLFLTLNFSFGYAQIVVNAQTDKEIYISILPERATAVVLSVTEPNSPPIKLAYDSAAHIAMAKVTPADFGKAIYSGRTPHDIAIGSLSISSDYTIYYLVYDLKKKNISKIDSLLINTLDIEPIKQSSAIAFKNTSYDNVGLLWIPGNGNNVLVTVSQGEECVLPKDGTGYTADANFGNPDARIPGTNTYVLYAGKNNRPLEVKVTGLEFAQYHFRIYEYNGNGKYANYLTTQAKNNPRTMFTKIPPPRNLSASTGKDGEWLLRWDEVKGAGSYVIDVAFDAAFANKLEPYNMADIGNVSEIPVVFQSHERGVTRLFCRLKSRGNGSESPFSEVYVIEIKP